MTDPRTTGAFLAKLSDAPIYWSVDILWTMLATGEQTGGAYSLMEELCPQGSGPPPHVHRGQHETFYILEGEITFISDGKTLNATAGSMVEIPPDTVHSFKVTSPTARMLNLYVPAGFENAIIELGEPALSRTLPPQDLPRPSGKRVQEVNEKYGMFTIEPVTDDYGRTNLTDG